MTTTQDRRRLFVTTSIPYVNADPHLGHALELVQADVLARHRRLRGHPVRLQSGTDDNSLKNVLAAERAGVPVAKFVTEHADRFEALAAHLDLSYDDFIRTASDPRHRPGVERLWTAISGRGDLYRKHYGGLYCVGCEDFYQPDELTDGRCPEHGTEPEPVAEENWFFRLSNYTDRLRDLYADGVIRVEPKQKANEVEAFIAGGLRDFSVSRSVSRARGWGLPVPGDPEQVIYVWLDALGNYITALDYGSGGEQEAPPYRTWWSGPDGERVHVIGKGILRFHAIYWPAILLSAGLPLPTRILVHDYLTVDGRKLSKTLGNVIDPVDLVRTFGPDPVRWWLVSQVPRVGDTDFTVERLVEVANRDLAGGVGNLVHRVTAMVHRFGGGNEATIAAADDTERICAELPGRIDDALAVFDLRRAATAITESVARVNRRIETCRPWELAKAGRTRDLETTLSVLISACRDITAELGPFLPGAAAELQARTQFVHRLSTDHPQPVFPRLEPTNELR